jgi:hypothetical protein
MSAPLHLKSIEAVLHAFFDSEGCSYQSLTFQSINLVTISWFLSWLTLSSPGYLYLFQQVMAYQLHSFLIASAECIIILFSCTK